MAVQNDGLMQNCSISSVLGFFERREINTWTNLGSYMR